MAGGFMAGAIVSKLTLDKSQWTASVKSVKDDTKTLGSRIQANSAQFKKYGRAMTIAGGIVVAGFAAMIKKASEAEETTAKFGTIFADVFPQASSAVDELTTSYGLSNLAAKTMLAATGDLLTGLGTQSDVALDLSLKTQKLSVDLASFTNFSGGAKGASEALTKAMLGERESIKALGIVVTEEMVKEELLRTGKENLTGQALLQAKAYATLIIATNQSKFAIGDYERTSGSFANTMRELQARLEDVITQLGAQLIPIATKLAASLKEVITKVSDWIKEHPKLTEIIVKFTAGLGVLMLTVGPLLMALPSLTKGFVILKGAILKVIPSMITLKASVVGVGGALKALVPVAMAAFIGWNIGRLIGRLTGLDGVIQNLTARVLGLGKITGYELTPALMGEAEAMQKLHRLFLGHDKSLTLLKVKYGSYNEALKAAKAGLEGETTATEVAGKAISDWGALMKKHGVLTVTEVSDKIGALKQKQDDLKSALDAGVIGLTVYKKGTKEAADEIKALKGITEEATKATETWQDYLHSLSGTTIPENEARVIALKDHLKELEKAFKDKIITLESYINATKAANDEIKTLSTTITTTAIPAAREWPIAVGGAAGEIKGHLYGLKEATKEATETITIQFQSMTERLLGFTRDLASGWANVFVNMLGITESITYQMKEFDNSYWENAMINAQETYDAKKSLLEQQVADLDSYYNEISAKTNEAYEKRKQWIELNVTDEEKKQEMLLALENKHQADLENFRADQLQKEQDLQNSLVKLEEDHQTESERIRGEEDAAREQHAIDEEARQNSLWNKVKTVFGQAVESMAQTWMTDLIQKMLLGVTDVATSLVSDLGSAFKKVKTGATDTASEVTSGLSGIGKTIADIGIGVATLITTLATAIATAATTLAAAAPALLIVLGIALAAFAGFKLISSLFKKKPETGTMEAILRDISHIQLAAILDKMDESNFFLSEMFPKWDYTNSILAKIQGICIGIRGYAKKMVEKLGDLPSAQFGAVLTQPGLVATHGTPSNPEIIMRQNDLMNIPRVRVPANVNLNQQIEFHFNNQVDPNFTQKYIRNVVIPEMYRGLQTSARKTKLKEILGV